MTERGSGWRRRRQQRHQDRHDTDLLHSRQEVAAIVAAVAGKEKKGRNNLAVTSEEKPRAAGCEARN